MMQGAGKSKSARRRAKKKEKQQQEDNTVEDEEVEEKLPMDSIVKIFATLTKTAYDAPWRVDPTEDVSGSGFVIEGSRILTNAHVVANASYVTVRKNGDARRVKARILSIAHDVDLALVTVDEGGFFKGVPPVRFSALEPRLQDEVFVTGYPEGGDSACVTKGIVSRIEAGPYTESLEGLIIQIDAAINPGASGAPCFVGSDVIGVAFAGLDDADNVGYIIPVIIVNHFLRSIQQYGVFRICSLGVEWQEMENEALCELKKMTKEMTGVLVTWVDPMGCCAGKVEAGDVILKVCGQEVACDGTVRWRKRDRVHFEFLIQSKFPGDEASLVVLRNGNMVTLQAALSPRLPLVPDTLAAPAKYLIFAGLVFVPLSLPFLESYGDGDWQEAPEDLTNLFRRARRQKIDEELVVLASVLTGEVNVGYESFEGELVKEVNGVAVNNLLHLHKLLTDPELPEMVQILFSHNLICVRKSKAASSAKRILKTHKIPSDNNLFEDQ